MDKVRPGGSIRAPGSGEPNRDQPPITGLDGYSRRPLSRVNPSTISKAIDSQTGEPLVVFHGTGADFSTFSDRKLGENTDGNASSEAYAQTARRVLVQHPANGRAGGWVHRGHACLPVRQEPQA